MRALSIISADHRNMAMVANALDVLGRRFADGVADDTNLHTVELIADYFETFSDRFHHARESDVLFARMRQRSERGRELLDRLDRDHRESPRILARVRHLAGGPRRHEPETLDALARAIALFLEGFRDHMRVEDEECLPLAREVLTAEDWEAVDAAFDSYSDPLAHDDPAEAAALLRTRVTQLLPTPLGLGAEVDHAVRAPSAQAADPLAALDVDGLVAGYGRIQVLHGVSLRVPPGQLVALIGANGAGKTTLLRCVSGVQPVTGGAIRFHGRDITATSATERVRAGICQVPEGRHVFQPMTVEDNLRLGAYTRPAGEVADSLEEVYGLFPTLRERRHRAAGVLSGGQQQMVALGRALMGKPKLLLLDEPSMGLAPLVVAEIFRAIRLLLESGLTVLLVEQNARAALSIADHAYVLETGRILLEGKGSDLLHDDEVRRAYLGM